MQGTTPSTPPNAPYEQSMRSSKSGSLTLGPIGQKGGGGTFCLIFSLILEQSVHCNHNLRITNLIQSTRARGEISKSLEKKLMTPEPLNSTQDTQKNSTDPR